MRLFAIHVQIGLVCVLLGGIYFCKDGDELVISKVTGLWVTVHSFANFDVDVAIVGNFE